MSLQNKVLKGSVWTLISTIVKIVVQVAKISILARILEKSDFGLLAVIVLVVSFTSIFSDLGISTALYSSHELSIKQKSSLYWMNFILSVILYIALLLFTPLIVSFYDNMTALSELIPLLGIDLIISGASKQFRVYKQKDMEFKQIAVIDILTTLVSFLLAYFLAVKGYGVLSLVYSTLFASTCSTLLIVFSTIPKHNILFYLNLKEVRNIYKKGMFQSGAQILDFVVSQLDIILIGKLMSTSELGVYSLVKQLVLRIYQLFNVILGTVGLSALSNIKDNMVKLKANYLKGLLLITSLSGLVFGVIAIFSRLILFVMYGNEFMDYDYLLSIWCVWAVLTCIGNFASNAVVVSGMTQYNLYWTMIRIVFGTAFVVAGSYYGMLGIVISQVLFSIIFYFVYWKVVIRRIMTTLNFSEYFNVSLLRFFKLLVIVSVISFFQYGYIKQAINNDWIGSSISLIVFLFCYILLFKSESLMIRDMLYNVLLKKSR